MSTKSALKRSRESPSVREKSANLIQSRVRERIREFAEWVQLQRRVLRNNPEYHSTIKEWMNPRYSLHHLRIPMTTIVKNIGIVEAPRGYMYRTLGWGSIKVLRRLHRGVILKDPNPTSWTIDPYTAVDFGRYSGARNRIVLRLPLNSPIPKLFIGAHRFPINGRRNSSGSIVHGMSGPAQNWQNIDFLSQAEVVLPPTYLFVRGIKAVTEKTLIGGGKFRNAYIKVNDTSNMQHITMVDVAVLNDSNVTGKMNVIERAN